EAIKSLATKYKLFLLEDCALSLGSKINGITLGNFGDAALFSTDHSKPINTIIGGLIYSNNKNLIHSLRDKQASHSELSIKKKKHFGDDFYLRGCFLIRSV
ncbi:MAG: DegT/DnrJ/EryC1/StrS family aminotransferase, partial [Deltaproteobacteria bacterium]